MKILSVFFGCLLSLAIGTVEAQSQPVSTASLPPLTSVVPDRDFFAYKKQKPTNATSDRIEVIYFYWYGSPWAQQIDRDLRQWAKTVPYSIRFVPAPASFGSNHEIFGARVFYALQLLGKEEEISPLLLDAVSQRRLNFDSVPEIIKWMEARGISEQEFLRALNDPKTKGSTAQVANVMKLYEIESVPTVVINGKYMVRAYDKLPPQKVAQIVKFLTKRLHENRGK